MERRRLERALAATIAAVLMGLSAENAANAATAAPNGRDLALYSESMKSPFAKAIANGAWLAIVDSASQRLALWRGGELRRVFTVSTAKAGIGGRDGSGKTPLGWHRIAEWIGRDALPGQNFVSRQPSSEVVPPSMWRNPGPTDKILTRIMWLEGLEPGINSGAGVDSRARFIYLHGTDQEHLLGSPASHGCIRLSNRDVMELFHLTEGQETLCRIF